MRFSAFSPISLALAAALSLVITVFAEGTAPSRDLLALWLAGAEVASGHPAAIYPAAEPLFTMRPAIDWYEKAAALGRAGPVYPYIYPPIWAFLIAPLTKLIGFSAFATAVQVLNGMALLLIPQLAVQLALGRRAPLMLATFWTVFTLVVMLATRGMPIAYLQGQVQIPVAFLTLLGLERAQNGGAQSSGAVTAGLALGLAIALKLSPLPVALIWLVCGNSRAGLVALGSATALGLASIGLAGWPLHLAFLGELSTINNTLLLSRNVASLDQIVSYCFYTSQISVVTTLPGSVVTSIQLGWGIATKPALYALLQSLAMPCLVLVFGLALRRSPGPQSRAALWGAALTTLTFVGPIGWLYYYIAPLALVPVLWLRNGLGGLALPALAMAMIAVDPNAGLPARLGILGPMLGSLGVCVLIAAFLLGAFKGGAFKGVEENPAPPPQSRLRRAAT